MSKVFLRYAWLSVWLAAAPVAAQIGVKEPVLSPVSSKAVAQFQAEAPNAHVSWSKIRQTASFVSGVKLDLPGSTYQSRAKEFVRQWPQLLGVTQSQLSAPKLTHAHGRTVVTFDQRVEGIPVLGASIRFTFNDAQQLIRIANSCVALSRVAPPAVSAQDAAYQAQIALAQGAPLLPRVTTPQLAILADATGAHVVWQMAVAHDPLRDPRLVSVNAHTGIVARVREGWVN